MSDTSAPPRWIPYVTVVIAIVGSFAAIGGMMIAYGGWRSQVDQKLVALDERLATVETTQRTNMPLFYRMQADIAYLAERARAEQARRDREPVR